MNTKLRLSTTIFVLLSIFVLGSQGYSEDPEACKLQGVPRIKQLTNYCGPAALTSVLQFYGSKSSQEAVGKVIYDPTSGATNGADMLLYARNNGYKAYSWNSSVDDVKKKLAQGAPVIVLQQNSVVDTSGHFRVLTGFDESKQLFYVVDPYYDSITSLSYRDCQKLWSRMGCWALVIVQADKDIFQTDLEKKNPVVHMDLSFAYLKKGDYPAAMKEANAALALEPGNKYVQGLSAKIRSKMSAEDYEKIAAKPDSDKP